MNHNITHRGLKIFRGVVDRRVLAGLREHGLSSHLPVVDTARMEAAAVGRWNYLPIVEEDGSITPILSRPFLRSVLGEKFYTHRIRRRPFYKVNNPKGEMESEGEIAEEWHRDRDRGQTTVIILLSRMSLHTAHTEVFRELVGLSSGLDPRRNLWARLLRRLKILTQSPIIAEGNPGDVIVLETHRLLHRVSVPSIGECRESVFLSFADANVVQAEDSECMPVRLNEIQQDKELQRLLDPLLV